MSPAYERVRQALEGTPLAGELDRLNAELHLTPDAAEWVIAALAAVGTAALARDLQAVERALGRLPDTLESSMRASGSETVRGLGDEIATATTQAIRDDAVALLGRCATVMEEHVAGLVQHGRSVSETAQSEIEASSRATTMAARSLTEAAVRVGGWTPARIASTALGAVLAATLYAAGAVTHPLDVYFGCGTRVDRVTHGLHLAQRQANAVRAYVCRT